MEIYRKCKEFIFHNNCTVYLYYGKRYLTNLCMDPGKIYTGEFGKPWQ